MSLTPGQRNERLLEREARVLQAISSHVPLGQVFLEITQGLEALIDDGLASILRVEPPGVLRHGAAPGLPESYNDALDGLPIGPRVGSCGTAAFRREPVIVSDIENDPLWADYLPLARAYGLRACWSIPVINGGDLVVATFAIYYRQPRTPDPEDLQLAARMATLVRIAMERERRLAEQALAEEALRRSRSLLEMATRVSKVGAWQLEQPSNAITWSERMHEVFDVPAGFAPELESIIALYAPESRAEIRRLVEACIAHGAAFDTELVITGASGRRIDVRAIGEAVRDAAGTIVRIQGAVQDITAQKALEARERELSERLAATLDSITDGFLTMDRDLRVTYINRQGALIAQRPPAALVGRRLLEAFPEAIGTIFERKYQEVLRTQRPVHFDSYFAPLNVWVELSVHPTAEGLAVYLRDVTARQAAQQEIVRLNAELEERVQQRTAELSAAVSELESFSYTISHDLRAPLRTMDGFSDAVLADYGDRLPAEGRHYLNQIRGGARRMGLLIDDLLEFARAGRREMRLQPVEMRMLVADALAEMARLHPGRAGDVRVQPLPAVQGDPGLLLQVWTNLLSNALKYTSRKGSPRIEVDAVEEGGEIGFRVRDNGAGFNPAHAGKLFGVFHRLHPDTEFEGTGVGLAIVKRIVERHGGRVGAQSVPGQGATFTFWLPKPLNP